MSTRAALPIEKTARLVARALGCTPGELAAGLRPARADELPSVLELRRLVIGADLHWDDDAYLRWRYQFGAEGQGLATCWVCTLGERLLGMIGVESLRLQAGEQVCDAHVTMDIMVRPELDGVGLGVWINQAICERLGCVLAVGSNPNSRGVIARTFEPLPDRRSHAHPLNFGHFMAKRLSLGWLAALAAWAATTGMVLFRVATLWLASSTVQVSQAEVLGPEVESLLERAKRSRRVEVFRSLKGLSHRLLRNPRSPAQVWLARRGGEVVGLMAVRRTQVGEQRHALQIMDVVLDRHHEDVALRALLAHVAARGFREGAEYLSVTLYAPELEARFSRLFFRHQPHPYETMAWSCPEGPFKDAVLARNAWSLMDIHTDRDQG
ncbi:hypothetical protein [Aquabacterium parvum]|uniref:hypothetical protein n=1 Tax=Aquabacterium parvum TaxID=70584 RepID=UPI00128EE0D4|nr:hypothetical protein [Aquabacterium parvum]